MRAVGQAVRLVGHSIGVVRAAPRLMLVAAAELVVLVLLLGLFGYGILEKASHDALFAKELMSPGALALLVATWYTIASYVSGLFAVVFAEAALQLDAGVEVDLRAAAKRAWKLKWTVLGLVAFDATIGWVLRIGERKDDRVRKIGRRVAGAAWSAVRALTVPVAAVEGGGPRKVIKRAGALARGRWGVNVVGGLLVPVVAVAGVMLVGIPAFGLLLNTTTNPWVGIVTALVLVAAAAAVKSMLSGILSTMLYLDATRGARSALLRAAEAEELLEDSRRQRYLDHEARKGPRETKGRTRRIRYVPRLR